MNPPEFSSVFGRGNKNGGSGGICVMSKSKVGRIALMGTAAAVALLGAASTAQAVETQFGDVQIIFDTTVSMGVSMRTADTETEFLPEGNGGPVDPRDGPGGVIALENNGVAGAVVPGLTGRFRQTLNVDNFDGSSNADDGRLNFDNGDLIGATAKANHDLQVTWRNYKFFARAVGFYDVVMNDKDVGARSQLTDAALGDVGRNYELLDLFVSADYTVADMPVNLRVGKQVINWGESTFILGGNNVFNPIDVAAFRRPGSEIKEALVPVNAVSGSISLPFDVSLSGYYALDWEPFELDPSGTPFSSSDVASLGTGLGGNEGLRSQLSGSPLSGMRRTCLADAVAFGNAALASGTIYNFGGPGVGLLKDPNVAQAGSLDCLDSPFVRSTVPYTIGQNELIKQGLFSTLASEGVTRIGQGLLTRDLDPYPDDSGQWGISARWYAESLGGTEFGFYYQNYHSRLPFAAENARLTEVHVAPAGSSFQLSSGQAGRFALPTGCLIDGSPSAFLDPRISSAVLGQVPIGDPEDILNATAATAALGLGIVMYNNPNPAIGYNNMYAMIQLNCALASLQSGISPVTGRPTLFDGAEVLTASSDLGLFLEYPEDIEALGLSFNTTLWGWGIQGDFTYRDDAPFQIDTDSITIGAAMSACAFPAGVADLTSAFEPLGTYPGVSCFANGSVGNRTLTGVLKNQMYTAQLGTTSTFTASDWWVDALGADLGILVTEVGMMLVPGVEDTWLDKYDPDGLGPANPTRILNQYQNTGCNGSDLPLGGLLGLDRKASSQCRPNDFSAGLVMLVRMDYNNAFNSGWQVTPQLVYSYDFEGTTPAPYGNYIEDRQAVGLSVTGTLNNNLRLGASYSNFFGGHVQNKSKDQDFTSLTASYTF
jgi:Protein of unknown function (DUF1302)